MNNRLSLQQAKADLIAVSESLFSRGLTPGASANISVRWQDGYLVTPTNSCLGFLNPQTLSVLNKEGVLVDGEPPSKEFQMHQAFYRSHQDVGAVIHLHSTFATALSCSEEPESQDAVKTYTPYLTMRLGRVVKVPYYTPGSAELFAAVTRAAADHRGILLANHGPVVAAGTLMQAMFAMEELEESCKIEWLLNGTAARQLTENERQELLTKYYGKI